MLLLVPSAGAAGGLPWYAILSLPLLFAAGMCPFVAVFIGGLEVLQVMSGRLDLSGGVWDYVNNFDLNQAGFVIVGLFVLTWAIALSVWRFAHIEEKWSAGLRPSERSRAFDTDFLADRISSDLPVLVVDEPVVEGAAVG